MKHQYVADVNDYLKYALLRALIGLDLDLAVAWMLTGSDGRADGQRLSYLARPQTYRPLDPQVFDVLHRIVGQGARSVHEIERAGILRDTVFLPHLLTDGPADRERYFQQAWRAAQGRAVLFFDPDNGMAVASVPKGRRNSAKYLYWDELAAAYARGHSLVVYQHFPRRPRGAFVSQLADRIREEVAGCADVLALATSHVAFLLVPQPRLAFSLSKRLDDFSTRAARHMTTVTFMRPT